MKKYKMISILMAVFMLFNLTVCQAGESTENASAGGLAGGWSLTAPKAAAELPDDIQKLVDKSFAESDLIPVGYLGSQVAAGVNHMLLCWNPADELWQITIIYCDLDGNTEMPVLADFDLTPYTEPEETDETEAQQEVLDGGWAVAKDCGEADLPEDVEDVFDKAEDKLLGNDLDPIALLGTQVVAGTNYAFLCESELETAEEVKSIQVVIVYADLQGGAEITNIKNVNLADYGF